MASTMAVNPVDIRKIIYDATVNRKPDFLLGMDIKPFLDSEEKRNDLANTLLEQTFQGMNISNF